MTEYSNFIAGGEWILLIIIGIIVAVVVGAVRKKSNSAVIVGDEPADISGIEDEHNSKSLKILKERLAKGEITKDEFNRLKREFE